MRRAFLIVGIVFGVFILIGVGAFIVMSNSASKGLASLVYEKVDMSFAADGTYYGEADAGMVYAKVGVTVENHAIKSIDIIEHRNGKGARAETIVKDMVAANSYDVDTVSGATLSSKTIQSAVSKALKQSCTE